MPKLIKSMTEEEIRGLRSCLVQYRGGGYEGCFWEWNYAFFDPHGNFHNLMSTGRDGCEDLESLVDHLLDRRTIDYRQPYLYQLDKEEDAKEFISENNHGGVVLVAAWLHKNWPELDLKSPCTNCGCEFPLYRAEHDGYRGAGGLSIVMCGLVCPDCVCKMIEDGEEEQVYSPQIPTEHIHTTKVQGEATGAV